MAPLHLAADVCYNADLLRSTGSLDDSDHEARRWMSTTSRKWITKFQDAFRGVRLAVCSGSSFVAHLIMAAAVIVAGVLCRVSITEWCLLAICIALVLAAEAFNSALESLAKSVTSDHDHHVGRALDMAAGAVLILSIGAAVVGLVIFVPYALLIVSGE